MSDQARIEELRRQVLMKRVEEQRARQSQPEAADTVKREPGFIENFASGVKGFMTGPVGDGVPILGPIAETAANAATAAGETIYSAGRDLLSSDRGMKGAKGYADELVERYQKNRDFNDQRKAEHREKYPISSAIKHGVEGLALPGPKGLGMTGRGAGLGNAAGRIAGSATIVGADSALRGQDMETALGDAERTAYVGAGMEALPVAAKALGKGYSRFVAGVKPKAVDHYMKRGDMVNAADRDTLVREIRDAITETKSRSAAAKARVADTLEDSFRDFRKSVSKQSGDAFGVLEDAGVHVKTSQLKGFLTHKLNEAKIGQALPDSADIKTLQYYRQLLDDTGEKYLSGTDVKRLLQRIDKDLDDVYKAARSGVAYTDRDARSLSDFRGSLDKRLKKAVPEYAQTMKPLAEDTRALSGAVDQFGEGDKLRRRLDSVFDPKNKDRLDALKAFEARAGKDITGDLQRALDIERPIRGLNEKGSEPLLNRAMRNRPDVVTREQLGHLSKMKGTDFSELIDDLGTKEAFTKPFIQGSRNTAFGGWSLSGLASALGASTTGIPVAGAVGALVGHMSDLVGSKVVKAWLDQARKPGFQAFARALDEAMKRGPQAVVVTHNLFMRDPEYRALIGED